MSRLIINPISELYHHGVEGQKWGIRKEEDEGPKFKASHVIAPAVIAATIGVGLGIISGKKKYTIMGSDGPIINKGKIACTAILTGLSLAAAVGLPAIALEQNRANKEYESEIKKYGNIYNKSQF